MKKSNRVLVLLASIAAFASIGLIFIPTHSDTLPRCTCAWTNGEKGVLEGEKCVVRKCLYDKHDSSADK